MSQREEIAADTDAAVAKIDVDAQRRLARQYQVQGVPTLYLFTDGDVVEQIVGLKQKRTVFRHAKHK